MNIFIIAKGRAIIIAINAEKGNLRRNAFKVIPRARVTTKKNQILRRMLRLNFMKIKIRKTAIEIAITIEIKLACGEISLGGSVPKGRLWVVTFMRLPCSSKT